MAPQYSLDTLAGEVATVKRTLGRVSSAAILVGHSYGGSVITAAGADGRVAGLVYIAALAPDASETSQTQQANFPKTNVFSHVEVADGRVWMLPEGVECFAGDLPEQEKKVVWATHFAPAVDLLDAKVEGTAWKFRPTWYIVAKSDRTVQPELALLREAHGRNHLRSRQQSRPHAFESQPSDRRDPYRRERCSRTIHRGRALRLGLSTSAGSCSVYGCDD